MKVLLLAVAFVAMLSGCVTTASKAHVVVEQQRIEVVEVNPELLQPCVLEAPPSVKAYMRLSKDGREDLLTRYAITSVANTKACSSDKATIAKIQAAQRDRIKAFNDAEALRVKKLTEGSP